VAALSANSPFWSGVDTGYASYRRMLWDRWPASGPFETFGSVETYDRAVETLVTSGVLLDPAMVYLDARLSARYPTVEIRVTDVCLEVDDAVAVAGLCRALVETAAQPWWAGVEPAPARMELLRGAAWRAARSGLTGDLVDVVAGTHVPAPRLVHRLLDHVRAALQQYGDEDAVEQALRRILAGGTGAQTQRAAHRRRGRLADVAMDAVARTCRA
jgi:carboxylate-amine ligase